MPKIKVINITSEVAPFAKVGGLADVVGSLPQALLELGVDARVVVPRYAQVDLRRLRAKKEFTIKIPLGQNPHAVTVFSALVPNTKVPVWLLDEAKLLSRGSIYASGPASRNRLTNRFLYFCKAAFRVLERARFRPDIVHAHDWPTAPTALMLSEHLSGPYFKNSKSVITLHNIYNQNRANVKMLHTFGIRPEKFSKFTTETAWGKIEYNLLGQSLLVANAVNTVSPTHAREILKPEISLGLERVLKNRTNKVSGILNGIDTNYFDPEKDLYIAQAFSASDIEKKSFNKQALQKRLRLSADNGALLCGVVTRLSSQKGVELITTAVEKLAGPNFQFAILGDGDPHYEQTLKQLQFQHSGHIAFVDRYDSHLAREIYAGADVFLMPSAFEPCGLTQMIAMRYGTVPVVHDTGGLHDTVKSYPKKGATGFVFKNFNVLTFFSTLKQAKKIFDNKPAWQRLQLQGMKQDFSWKRSAREYVKLYKKLIK